MTPQDLKIAIDALKGATRPAQSVFLDLETGEYIVVDNKKNAK